MAYRIRLQQIVLCITNAALIVHSSDLPATFQFDIVFPREGGNYKPVERFPVVFALYNGSRAGSVPLTLSWAIKAMGPCADPLFAISVDGEVPRDKSPHEMCGLSPNRTQKVQKCATLVDDEMVKNVAARMLTEKLAPMTSGASSPWQATREILCAVTAIVALLLI